ncbi:MAG: thiamine-phosphate pyrophosphorylase [Candidatus Omnitrophota bacterium]
MPKQTPPKAIYRIIDANINRAKEGLRVCEEIVRFSLNNRNFTAVLKKLRHALDGALRQLPAGSNDLLSHRNIRSDVGSRLSAHELKRKDMPDIFYANIQRVKESMRVLEEFSKLLNRKCSLKFKKIRYDVYQIEKKISRRF